MRACCISGYCAASDAADKAESDALEWEALGYGDREDYGITFVSESDLPAGTYEADMEDIGIALDHYLRGYDY